VKQILSKNSDKVNATCASLDLETALHKAAEKGNIEIVKLLLENGAKIDVEDTEGWRPLHMAAWNGEQKVVKLLLEKKADVNAQNKYGKIPLSMAYQNQHASVVKLIESKIASL